MERLFVNLISNPGAGKSTLARYISDKYGFSSVRPSSILAEYANSTGRILSDRQSYIDTHNEMRARFGESIFTDIILGSDDQEICLDGLRVPADIERLRKHGKMVVIALWCPIRQRFERHCQRAGVQPTEEEYRSFFKDQAVDYFGSNPSETSTVTIMGQADYHLDTSLPLDQTKDSVDKTIADLV